MVLKLRNMSDIGWYAMYFLWYKRLDIRVNSTILCCNDIPCQRVNRANTYVDFCHKIALTTMVIHTKVHFLFLRIILRLYIYQKLYVCKRKEKTNLPPRRTMYNVLHAYNLNAIDPACPIFMCVCTAKTKCTYHEIWER